MMRVALISPLYESVPPKFYGGTERVVYNLARGLVDAGLDVTVFASGDSTPIGTLVPVVPEALRLARVSSSSPEEVIPYHFRLLSEVAARARQFDVIHNHHDYWMLPLTEMSSTPVLTTLHGQLDLPNVHVAFESFPKAHYVSISDSQRRPLSRLNWLGTIHHGIDAHPFRFHEKPGKYLAFLGRMSPQKRPDWAIEIARLSGVPLKMAAKIEGRGDIDYYESYVKPRIDGKFIEYVGEISEQEKSKFLGEALGLVFPIDWPEPFGLVMVESLACGTPVLARPLGAAAEILSHGVTGFLDLDIRKLAYRVRELESIERRTCRRWVEDKFSLKRMTEDYIHVYRHLVQLSDTSREARERWGKTGGVAGATGRSVTARGVERSDRHRWNLVHSVQRTVNRNP